MNSNAVLPEEEDSGYDEQGLRRKAFLVLNRRVAAAKANDALERAEARFMELAKMLDIKQVELPGATVQVIEGEKRTVSVDVLAEELPPETFNMVTKRAVDLGRLDQAVALGLVLESIARAATKVTPYKNVRVNVH